ncbi:MAG: hypothetical protein IKK57_03790 [Clostridia bacterium]|nr:hypothetical protein [Clostridia bacterium]
MNLSEMITRRRSVRAYLPEAVDEALLAEVAAFTEGLTPLLPGAEPVWRIIPTADASFLQKWQNPQFFAFYVPVTAEEDGLLNVGYMYQQLDLFLQGKGLGTCWVGLGWPDEKKAPPQGMKLAVMMAFGYPAGKEAERKTAADFKRRGPEEIADWVDDRLEPARLAPSATNSQPWFFTHDEHDADVLHVWREKLTLLKKRTHGRMNLIDMGIALAHLKVSNPGFVFTRPDVLPEKENLLHVGMMKL